MAKEKDLPRIHIILDASKTKRCDWCGSPQSDRWLTHREGTFCSNSCIKAASSENRCVTVLITGFTSMFFFWAWVWFLIERPWVPADFIIISVGVTIVFLVPLFAKTIVEFADHKIALKIPRGSRRHIGVSQFSLLKRISTPMECPNCDGNIDLDAVHKDMVYTCQYCGASGIIEIKFQV